MKFTIDKDVLAPTLERVAKSAASKSTIPAAMNVLLEAQDGNLFITATDFTVRTKARLDASVATSGSLAVAPQGLVELLKTIKDSVVVSSNDKNKLRVQWGENSKLDLAGLDATEFPEAIYQEDLNATYQIDVAEFVDAVGKTVFATSSDMSRLNLTGVLFVSVGDGKLEMIGTDSFRVAFTKIPMSIGEGFSKLIPATSLIMLCNLIRITDKKNLTVAIDERAVTFHTEDIEFTTLVIDAPFPELRSLNLDESTSHIDCNVKELEIACKQTAIISAHMNNGAKMVPCEGGVKMTAEAEDVGASDLLISATVTGDPNFEFGFSTAWLKDFLAVCDDSRVRIDFRGAKKPLTMFPVGNDKYSYLLMPLSL